MKHALVAITVLLWALPAEASNTGVTGASGKGGVYCKACHAGPDATYTLSVTMDPGPYSVLNVYNIRFTGRRSTSFTGGFNAAVSGPANGGKLSKPPTETNLTVNANEGQHTSKRSSSSVSGGFEISWNLQWRPPPVGQSGTDQVRLYFASNTAGLNQGKTQVLTDGSGTCDSTNIAPCGIPITVERLPCDDVDSDGYFPTACLADSTIGGGDCNDGSADARPGAIEFCDGLDNDCDGQTDEGFSVGGRTPGQSCDSSDTDLCTNGVVTCSANGGSASCVESVNYTEQCNGSDDDCDGLTDEGFASTSGLPLGVACDGPDIDVCSEGVVQCTSATSAACVEGGSGHPETCNGSDDDCDGNTDEGYLNLGQACDSTDADRCPNGIRSCTADGTATECIESVSYTEICNGVDDDCDALTDELFPTRGQTCDGDDSDRCKLGTLTCKPDGTGLECVNESASLAEQCGNVADDDCDGLVDEGCNLPDAGVVDSGPPIDAGDVDAGPPDAAINDAGIPDGCVPLPERCNGRDDDCNGQIDETFPNVGQLCDGPDSDMCFNGIVECAVDGESTLCDELLNVTEMCNGFDDDCDGTLDNGFIWRFLEVGAECDGTDSDRCINGAVVCTADQLSAECVEAASFTELCNNFDDDCNGLIDDGFPGLNNLCDSADDDECFDGVIACNADGLGTHCEETAHYVEMCNALDDDCDGLTDDNCIVPDAGPPDASEDAGSDAGLDASMDDAGDLDAAREDAMVADANVPDANVDVDAAIFRYDANGWSPHTGARRDASTGHEYKPGSRIKPDAARPFLTRGGDAGETRPVVVAEDTPGCSASAPWGTLALLGVAMVLRRRRVV